jgi:membrane protein YqaA with SNARE-associated domain
MVPVIAYTLWVDILQGVGCFLYNNEIKNRMRLSTREVLQLSATAASRGVKTFVSQNTPACFCFLLVFCLLSWYTAISMLSLLTFFLLGISSSIGFGVGVPSRVLFVVPWVLANAKEGAFLPDFVRVFPIMFVHAVGSALGELPPFLSAAVLIRHFRLHESKESKMAQLYRWMQTKMQKRRFTSIILLSAYPNATFDVAGLVAGASNMSTPSFLSATILGKAFIRAPVACAVIVCGIHNPWLVSKFPSFDTQKNGWLGHLWTAMVTSITFYTLWISIHETAKIEWKLKHDVTEEELADEEG